MMASLIQNLRAKLSANRGESITEVLVAIVVAGLAILMLYVVISTAVSVNVQSKKTMDEYYALNNALVKNQLSDSDSSGATAEGAVTLTLTDASGTPLSSDEQVTVMLEQENVAARVKYVISMQLGNTPIVSYKRMEAMP